MQLLFMTTIIPMLALGGSGSQNCINHTVSIRELSVANTWRIIIIHYTICVIAVTSSYINYATVLPI